MKNASLMLFGIQGKRLTIIAVSFIGGIVLVTKSILERQFVMLKYDGMNTKTKTANLNQLSI